MRLCSDRQIIAIHSVKFACIHRVLEQHNINISLPVPSCSEVSCRKYDSKIVFPHALKDHSRRGRDILWWLSISAPIKSIFLKGMTCEFRAMREHHFISWIEYGVLILVTYHRKRSNRALRVWYLVGISNGLHK